MGNQKSMSSRRRSGKRSLTGSGRNIPATPLNPKYRVIVWLELSLSALSNSADFTYQQVLKLAEAQLAARNIQTVLPTGNALIFNYVEVAMVEAWGSPITNSVVQGTNPSSYTNVTRLDLTVGPTSALMPRSTMADVCIGIGERAYVSVRGNATTWGEKTSTVLAAKLDWQTENQTAASVFLPMTLKFHVNVW